VNSLGLALLIATLSIAVQAQPPRIHISGKLIDATGSAVPFEIIELKSDPTKGAVAVAQTDAQGMFSFPGMLSSKYILATEELPNYKPLTKTIDATGNDIDLGVIHLEPSGSLCDLAPVIQPSPPVHSSPRFFVAGRVVDDRGAPIPNAIVAVWDSCSYSNAKTNRKGDVTVELHYACDCQVRITALGLKPTTTQIENWKGRKAELGNIVLHALVSQ
jgi:hypothetical protein